MDEKEKVILAFLKKVVQRLKKELKIKRWEYSADKEGKVMDEFEEVVPGVMVNKRRVFKIEFLHPDPIWVIRNEDETASIGDRGTLFVFSSEERAKKYMEKTGIKGGFLKRFSWDECVDKFGQSYSDVLVDHTGETGFCQNVPLKKGI